MKDPSIRRAVFLKSNQRGAIHLLTRTLDHLLARAPMKIREQPIPIAALREFQEAFITNSNAGILPVSQINSHVLAVGTDTLKLTEWLLPPRPPGIQYRFQDRGATQR